MLQTNINNIKYDNKKFGEVYLIYKNNLYKTIHSNGKKHVLINVYNNKLFFITWRLYYLLEKFKTFEEADKYYETYENVFNKNELSLLGSSDVFNYEYSEIPQKINISKSNLQHFKAANINILEQ